MVESAEQTPNCDQFFTIWDECRKSEGVSIPSFSSLTPDKIADLAHELWILDGLDDGDLRVRYFGSSIESRTGSVQIGSSFFDLLAEEGIQLDTLRVRGFPFGQEVYEFIRNHDVVFVVDQNRDAQMRTLLVTEGDLDPAGLIPVLYYGGLSISADTIQEQVSAYFTQQKLPRLTEVKS